MFDGFWQDKLWGWGWGELLALTDLSERSSRVLGRWHGEAVPWFISARGYRLGRKEGAASVDADNGGSLITNNHNNKNDVYKSS